MILVVSGWRDLDDAAFVRTHLMRYLGNYGAALHVRVGEQAGADFLTREWLKAMAKTGMDISHCIYHANWYGLGNAAGPVRNRDMLRGDSPHDMTQGQQADQLLAFPQPGVKMRSPGSGTAGCILEAHQMGISVDIPGHKAWMREERT